MSASNTHDLHTFMAQATHEMDSEYRRIYSRAAEDPGTAGDEGEENWATLFREWLPPMYHVVTKGRLIGYDRSMSPQIDVLVLKPFYPRKLLEKKVWLAGGVAAVFECKTTLIAEHVTASVERAVAFKNLFPPREGTPAAELRSPLFYGLLAHSHSWRGPASRPLENVTDAFDRASQGINHPRLLLDAICVADLATWTPMFLTYHAADLVPQLAPRLRASFEGDWGVTTSMNCASHGSERQSKSFTPIGSLIAFVTQRLARADPNLRDLADYYRMANLWGAGSGYQRHWPASVYSPAVRMGIQAGRVRNGAPWDEWALALL